MGGKPRQYKENATIALGMLAADNKLEKMRKLIRSGANPNCFSRYLSTEPKPLVKVLAVRSQMDAARLLMEHITNEMIEEGARGDWREDYDMSPLAEFCMAGQEDIAMDLLGRCRMGMTTEQWQDLLFRCVLSGSTGLIEECVAVLDDTQVLDVRRRLERNWVGSVDGWDRVAAAISRRELKDNTAGQAGGTGPTRRI